MHQRAEVGQPSLALQRQALLHIDELLHSCSAARLLEHRQTAAAAPVLLGRCCR